MPPSYGGIDAGPSQTVSTAPDLELPTLLIVAGENLAAHIQAANGSLSALRSRLQLQANPRPEWIWRADHA